MKYVCRVWKYVIFLCLFLERAFQVREKVMSAANWGTGNYLIVKENYIAEQIAPHVNIPLWIFLSRYFDFICNHN